MNVASTPPALEINYLVAPTSYISDGEGPTTL